MRQWQAQPVEHLPAEPPHSFSTTVPRDNFPVEEMLVGPDKIVPRLEI